MKEDFEKYFKKHTWMIMKLMVVAFLLLAAGEYYLYRQVIHLNRMMSEGLSQIKEQIKEGQVTPTPTPMPTTVKPAPTMMK
jgi:cell division protein FtsL